MKENTKCRVWVAGLGNILMKDDGAGVVAARILAENPPAGTVVSDVGTAIMFFSDKISDAESILCIDAVASGKKPGTVSLFTDADIDAAGGRWGSAHELSLLDAIDIFRNGKRPPIMIIGVEPEQIGYGLELSNTVKTAIPKIVELAKKCLGS